jgi:hypothetical protein
MSAALIKTKKLICVMVANGRSLAISNIRRNQRFHLQQF